jgi:hypothetical protein
MKYCFTVAATIALAVMCVPKAEAGTIFPYPFAGTANSETYTFTAQANGDIISYFYGANASDSDEIAMSVNGGPLGSFGLFNHNSVTGNQFNLGTVAAGDVLTFVLSNESTNTQISSSSAFNADATQHVYSVNYTNPGPFAVSGVPSGTLVSFEDLLASQGSDFDYNDDTFVFTNVSATTGATPLPASLPLFAAGLGVVTLLSGIKSRGKAGSAFKSRVGI